MIEGLLSGIETTSDTSPWLALVAVFIGGLLTAASPCVLAMIPLTMSFVAGGKPGEGGTLRAAGLSARVELVEDSAGPARRAAIARALAMEPRALLFDEPTSALDPELEQEVVRVIKDLAGEGRTMIIVTHDMRMANDVSDHVVFLHQGKIEEEGPPAELFGSPKTERLKGFLSATSPA